jgi:hypothetical protein
MKKFNIEIKWAIRFAITLLLWMVLEKMVGLHDQHIDKHMIYTNFFAIPAIAIYVFALLDKRKNFYGGVMTYAQGFIAGLIITIIVAALSPLTQYITSVYITPEYFPNVIDYVVSHDQMTQEAAEKQFNLQSYIFQGFIGTLVMGIVTSAVVAIFTKKKNTG